MAKISRSEKVPRKLTHANVGEVDFMLFYFLGELFSIKDCD